VPAIAVSGVPQPFPAVRSQAIVAGTAGRVDTRLASRAWIAVTDVLSLLAMVLAIPFVVLAVGIPVALALQLLLWIGRLL
jgi:hypothetical protein